MRVLTLKTFASLLFAAPAAAQMYEPTLSPAPVVGSPTTMTPLQLGDDNTAQVGLGFDFTYWGQVFNSAWVSSNGFVSFGTSANLCCNGFPIEQAPRNTIYGFWTDLVSYSGNPYYQRGEGSILFGWYGTTEYGTNNQFTFEITLTNDNKIRLTYANMPPLTYHLATAGITGPGADDNIQLFYGKDPGALKYQSGVLAWIEPKAAVDCAVTPLDPSCPPQEVASAQVAAVEQEVYAADIPAAQSDAVVEPEQEIATPAPTEEVQVESISTQVAQAIAAERLTPDQVAALAAPSAPLSSKSSVGTAVYEVPVPGAGIQMGSTQSGSSATFAGTFEAVPSSSSPTSVANTLEILNMSAGPAPQMSMAQADQQSGNAMAEGQGEAIAAIATVPGFSAYSQVSLRDRPDFYAIRKIYTRAKIDDAYIKLYRMTASSDAAWAEMVEDQYGR